MKAIAELARATEELRELARHAPRRPRRPRAQRGTRRARRPPPVSVELTARAEQELPHPVACAAYFGVGEALTDGAKHRGATLPRSGSRAPMGRSASRYATMVAAEPIPRVARDPGGWPNRTPPGSPPLRTPPKAPAAALQASVDGLTHGKLAHGYLELRYTVRLKGSDQGLPQPLSGFHSAGIGPIAAVEP